uniref:Uncharacterized protein n=1 Tax=Arundo donax TaxID=35708 RepID=A0A0A9D8G5_ARUDO
MQQQSSSCPWSDPRVFHTITYRRCDCCGSYKPTQECNVVLSLLCTKFWLKKRSSNQH